MTLNTYPALAAYIAERAPLERTADWCNKLDEDKAVALAGGLGDVAADLERAQADYTTQQKALGREGFPYNRAMGEYLGLPIKANGEPVSAYYMAGQVACHYRLGEAQREAARLIAEGRPLRMVAARRKADNTPCRFHVFTGADQIKIEGGTVVVNNGKVRVRFSPKWSVETCLQRLVRALAAGEAYGA